MRTLEMIVAALRRLPGTMDRLRGAEELIVPIIALGELSYGANRAECSAEQRAAIAAFMAGATLRTVSVETTEAYGLELATWDEHFHAIAGLRVQDWS